MKIEAVDLVRYRLVTSEVPEDVEVNPQEKIIIKKEREELVAKVIGEAGVVKRKRGIEDGWQFVKKLDFEDLKTHEANQEGERDRIFKAQDLANEQNLEMRIFASRYGWNKSIVSFFFTCEEAVDFRELLKQLNSTFHCRIHLERVGARDKARIIGGFGNCGQPTCCSTFKVDLPAVPMDAVRDQGIVIKDNNKLLGACGKLKCCLLYEVDEYRAMRKGLPHIKQTVMTPKKEKARVIGLDILNQKVKVFLLEAETIDTFDAADIKKVETKPQKTTSKESSELT